MSDKWLQEKITLISDCALAVQVLTELHKQAQVMERKAAHALETAKEQLQRAKKFVERP